MDSKSTLIIITVLTLSFGFIFNAFPIRSDNIIQGGGAPIIQNIVNGTVGPRGYNGTNGINGVNGTQGPQGPAGVVNGTSASFVNLYANGLVSFNNITSPIFVNYILSKVSEGSGLTASDIWEYVTRTLTNLNDTRADMIDNLDVLLSTRATQSSVDTIDGIVDSILVDTNELQVDWVNGGRLDLLIDAIKAKTDTIVANGATQASVDVIDGIVDSILVDTNELQVDWVNGGRLDLLIDAIKAKTDTIVANGATQASVDVIDGIVDSILVDTNELQVDWVNGGRLDLLLDSIITDVAATHTHVGTIDGHITADYAATEKAAIDLLDDAAGGLADIHTHVGTAVTDIAAVHAHVGTIDGHVTADYTATEKAAIDLLDDAAGGLVDIHTDVAAVKAETVLIVADTGELQTDWVNGGRLDLLIDAIKAKTDTIVVGATQASVDVIDGIVDSILVDTNELQVDWVNGGRLDTILDARASQTSVNTIDTVVDSILVDTSAMTLQPGWTPIISTTTTDPVANTYYTILNEATNGYLYTIAVTNNHATISKIFTLKVTIDGTVLTSGDETILALSTEYFFITGVSDTPSSDTVGNLFLRVASGGPWHYIPYDTSLKIEIRTTSITWATGFTGIVRRFIP